MGDIVALYKGHKIVAYDHPVVQDGEYVGMATMYAIWRDRQRLPGRHTSIKVAKLAISESVNARKAAAADGQ